MATRATYQINGTCFYIHWDGYPEGAAVYFWNMYKARQTSKGGYPEAFLRGNDGAEITPRHEAHGDTEWRYTMRGNSLTVYKRIWSDDGDIWAAQWVGHWWEFVNGNCEHIEGWEPLEPLPTRVSGDASTGEVWAVTDRAALTSKVSETATHLLDYVTNHPQMTGNIAYMRTEFNEAVDALCAYGKKYPHQKKVAA